MVWLLSLICPLVQLDVDQLGREEDGMGGCPGGLLVVGVVVDPRPLGDGGDQAVGVIHVQGHLSACLDMCCGGDMCWLAACNVVSCGSVCACCVLPATPAAAAAPLTRGERRPLR